MIVNRLLCSAVMLTGLLVACEGEDPEDTDDTPNLDGGGPLLDAGLTDSARPEAALPGPFACDGSDTMAAGDSVMTLTHGGVERRFLLHVPASFDGTHGVPLVIDIHGYGGTAEFQRSSSGWLAKSDEEGFLLVHPEGRIDSTGSRSWNGGSLCCGESLQKQVDDEGFMRAIVAKLKSDACVDPKRVYATGLSNGGALSHLLACRASDVFAATAPMVMGNGTMPCEPERGISVTMYRATGDVLVPYGEGGKYPSAEADFEQWKTTNECTGEPTSTGPCKTYANCKDGAEVTLCTITTTEADAPWGGHLLYPYAAREGVAVPALVWPMFERHPLPDDVGPGDAGAE